MSSIYICLPHLQLIICDPALENRAYVHKSTHSHYSTYLTFCVSYTCSVICIKCSSVYFTSCKYFNDKLVLLLGTKLQIQNFKVQKSGQILHVHKPYFLMPDHICDWILENRPNCHTWPIPFYWPS